MIGISTSGSFDKTETWLRRMAEGDIYTSLEKYGQEGVDALSANTPEDTGETANSWYYEILREANSWSIVWGNTNIVDGRPIAVLLQYGHGTGTGGYVEGTDYINPVLQPIFDRIANEAWKAVTAG